MRAITNSQGAVVASYEYDPYGHLISSTGSIISRSGYFGYAGEYTDRESKLVYLRARYYDPSTQQFINRDPLVGASGEPYGYVGGSPLNGRDPGGLFWDWLWDAASIGMDLKDIADNGLNCGNGAILAADVVLGIVPFVPSGVGHIARGGKALAHADNIGDAANIIGSGKAYSVAFETRLASSAYPGVTRKQHFQMANEHLLRSLDADPQFAAGMEALIPGLRQQLIGPRGGISRSAPEHWTWHHAHEAGVMQLVPRIQHQAPGRLQGLFHPGGIGGYSIWGK